MMVKICPACKTAHVYHDYGYYSDYERTHCRLCRKELGEAVTFKKATPENSLSSLGLSKTIRIRLEHHLYSTRGIPSDCATIQNVAEMSLREMYSIRRFGEKSVKEIVCKLAEHGIEINDCEKRGKKREKVVCGICGYTSNRYDRDVEVLYCCRCGGKMLPQK